MDEQGVIELWLASKGVTLWADWDVTSQDRVQLAAQWFQKQMDEYNDFSNGYWSKYDYSSSWDVV